MWLAWLCVTSENVEPDFEVRTNDGTTTVRCSLGRNSTARPIGQLYEHTVGTHAPSVPFDRIVHNGRSISTDRLIDWTTSNVPNLGNHTHTQKDTDNTQTHIIWDVASTRSVVCGPSEPTSRTRNIKRKWIVGQTVRLQTTTYNNKIHVARISCHNISI